MASVSTATFVSCCGWKTALPSRRIVLAMASSSTGRALTPVARRVMRERLMLIVLLALVAASLVADAQSAGPVRTIGTLGHTNASSFEEGLRELGWVEGKNVRFERRLSTDPKELARFAAELARMPVDVIFAGNAPATRDAVEATRAIPIITVS